MIKKFFFLTVFFVIYVFFFYPTTIFAADWIKYPQNPIFSGSSGWDQDLSSPAVIKDGNKLKMWYQGGGNTSPWSIGYAESTNGIDWQRTVSQPVLVPKNETGVTETAIVEPAVVKTDRYHLWYNSQNNTVYKIRYAYSDDGINWTKYPGYVLVGEADWEKKGVVNPSVIYKDGKFLMWYAGWGYNSGWQIGYAESTDGINWVKSNNNPLNLPYINHLNGQSVVYNNNQFHMTYHTGGPLANQIYYLVSNNGLNWNCLDKCQIFSSGSGFDSQMTLYPEIINMGNQFYVYYAGYDNRLWRIGLASQYPIDSASDSIIIIPGLFASWNKQALVYNQPVAQDQWRLNPYVYEYEGLKQTLINFGYQENKDFFIFAYDWRKGLNFLADDLNNYINQLNTNHQSPITNFNIIGHSLGGLVGRTYAQKYNSEKIKKLITVGSPHQGAAQSYKAVEGGEFDKTNDFLWLGQKLLLQLYRDGLKTDRQIINEKIPVIKDLLPTFNFLKNENNEEISIAQMKIKNDTLLSYQDNFPAAFEFLSTISGEKTSTLFGYRVGQQTILDQILNLYPDGRPIENFYQIGDGVVLSLSAQAGNNNKILNFDHGEIIYKKEAIKEILNTLTLPYQEDQIVEGRGTKINPSLLFLILSPAEIKVIINNNTYIENDGLILIEDAPAGIYQLEVIGKEKGNYQVLVGQITNAGDQWTTIYGTITTDPPETEINQYQINFNPDQPLDFPLVFPNLNQYFDYLINLLVGLNSSLNNPQLNQAIKNLKISQENYLNQDYDKLRRHLNQVHEEIFRARRKTDSITTNRLYDFISELENLYQLTLKDSSIEISRERILSELERTKASFSRKENKLLNDKKTNDVSSLAIILKQTAEKILEIEKNLNENNLFSAEIILNTAQNLLAEIK